MQKKLFTALALIVTLNILIKPLWIFGIDLFVQNKAGSQNYGLYASLLNFSLWLTFLLDMGINNFNVRYMAQTPNLIQNYTEKIIGLKIMLAALYAFATFAIGIFINYNTEQLYLLIFLTLNQILNSFILYFRSNIAAVLMLKTESFLSILDKGLMLLLGLLLLLDYFQPKVIYWFIYLQTIAYTISLLIVLQIFRKNIGNISIKFNYKFSRVFIKKSLPFSILLLLGIFYTRLETVLIERLLPNGKDQAGIFAAGFRLYDAANMIGALFASFLIPTFAKQLKNNLPIWNIFNNAFNLLFLFSISLALSSVLFAHEIITLLYHQFTNDILETFILLMLSVPLLMFTYTYGALLTANNNIQQLNRLSVVLVAINITSNILLIPLYQAVGGASAVLITQFVNAVLLLVATKRIFKIPVNKIYISKLTLIVILSSIAGFYIKMLLHLPWFYELILCNFALIALALTFKLFDKKQLIRILHR